MQLTSANIGFPQTLDVGGRPVLTGIRKHSAPGGMRIGKRGLQGDAIVDTDNHGGPDQAVYVYGGVDYDWWESQLDRPLAPGLFGENLTVSGLASADCAIGDRLQIGRVVLEVTAPRIPCSTFAVRMGEAGWVATFRRARRPGAYCRVIQTGTVMQGDPVVHERGQTVDRVELNELFDDWYARSDDVATLQRFLGAPVAVRVRADLEARLADAGARGR